MAVTANRLEHLVHPGVLQHREMPANRHQICFFHRQLWMFRLVIGTRTESPCWRALWMALFALDGPYTLMNFQHRIVCPLSSRYTANDMFVVY